MTEDAPRIHPAAKAAVDENLMPGESIRVVVIGALDAHIIGTDRRVFVFKKGFRSGVGMGQKLASWDYRNLSGVQLETGIVSGVVSLQGPGVESTDVHSGGRGKADPRKAPHAILLYRAHFDGARTGVPILRALISNAQGGQRAEPAQMPSVPPPASDIPDQLRKLGELRDAGILTAAEFESKKAELLARM